MAVTVAHYFLSTILDDPLTPTLVRPSNWNEAHVVTGTIDVVNGGTGQSAALVAGSVVYGASTTAMAVTAAGIAGQVLTSQGASPPTWAAAASGAQDYIVQSYGII